MIYVPFRGGLTLDDSDQATAHSCGPTIYQRNRDVNAEEKDYHKRPKVPQEVERLGAVLAYTRLAGVEPVNLCLTDDWKGKGCINCYLPGPDGPRETNVVYTRLDPPQLIKDADRPHYPSYFMLMAGSFPTYWFCGWSTFPEFITPANLTWRESGPKYLLRQHQLHPTLWLQTVES